MLLVTILTLEKTAFEGEVISIKLPGTVGYFEVLQNHASMISTLQPGKITLLLPEKKVKFFAISGGVVEVFNNKILVLGDAVESPEEIDIERAKEAYRKANARLEFMEETTDHARASRSLLRAKNRIQVYEEATKQMTTIA